MKEYKGVLDKKAMKGDVKKAYSVWGQQRERCNSRKNKNYKWYGAKGIRVEYTSREFIDWYINAIKKFNGNNPSVGRIDHNKNYSFDNIELQSIKENAREMRLRNKDLSKKFMKKVLISDSSTGDIIKVSDSVKDAADFIGVSPSTVCRYLKVKSNIKNWIVQYA